MRVLSLLTEFLLCTTATSLQTRVNMRHPTSHRALELLVGRTTTNLMMMSNKPNGANSDSSSFVSQPRQLYIEDTDAYGVMYNGNYLQAYERALFEIHNDSDFCVTHCTNHKFKSSPPLGGQYVIQGTMLSDHVDESAGQVWSLKMVEHRENSQDNDKPLKVYNTAVVTTSTPKELPIILDPFSLKEGNSPFVTKSFTIHRDEFDGHMPAIPMTTVLKLFERIRSEGLGGPERLRQMQEEDDLLFVVTSVEDLQIANSAVHKIRPGDNVEVRMNVELKRKGMFIACHEELLGPDNAVLAKGTVTICTIDRTRGRPTSNLPQQLKEKIEKFSKSCA